MPPMWSGRGFGVDLAVFLDGSWPPCLLLIVGSLFETEWGFGASWLGAMHEDQVQSTHTVYVGNSLLVGGASVVWSIHFSSPRNGLGLADLELGYNLGSEFSRAGQGGNVGCCRRSWTYAVP